MMIQAVAGRSYLSLAALLGLIVMLCGRAPEVMAQLPAMGALKADLVVVYKSKRMLNLKRQGKILRSYPIALGQDPLGHKRREGDSRTPEGVYKLDWRNPASQFYRSIHVSYPAPGDHDSAERWGVSPGGLIMIHGLPNGRDPDEVGHPRNDWTNGCIAVTNSEMDEIWGLVDNGTTIIIFP